MDRVAGYEHVLDEIHKINDLNDKLINTVKEYIQTTDKKATTQDNILWDSIIILAKRIHDLED